MSGNLEVAEEQVMGNGRESFGGPRRYNCY